MKASELLIKAIKGFEGYRGKAYLDSVGVPTIAYGHTKGVRLGMTCDTEQAERWLREDLSPIEERLSSIQQIDTQAKFDACADFCYNLGLGNFNKSTLLKKIRHGAPTEQVQAEFRRWNKAGGKVLKGLVRRREWEAQRWAE